MAPLLLAIFTFAGWGVSLDPCFAARDRPGMPVTPIRPPGKLVSPWQLRIELLDVKPQVWRRRLVPAGIVLPALHRVFQAALGWTNSHLHEFIINGERYAEPNPEWIDEMTPRAPFAPVCLAGENACPPEDVGGPPGYAQFLAKGGKAFDPARFDREAVNRVLGTMRL